MYPKFESGPYVFSATHGLRPIRGHSKTKKSIPAAAKIEDFKLKDLREKGATRLSERIDFSFDVVGQVRLYNTIFNSI